MMRKISTHLWYDSQAEEAARMYTGVFADSRIRKSTSLPNTPSGTVSIITADLAGREFVLLNAGPAFTFNPSISLMVRCSSVNDVNRIWSGLSGRATPLMELGAYPFSERFGWLQDRFGLSWQVMLVPGGAQAPQIVPTLMFTGNVGGKAEEAMALYTSVLSSARIGEVRRHGKGEGPDAEGTVRHAAFMLEGQEFAAMDSAHPHGFRFNEAISFIVHCDTQHEIDHFWAALSADPNAEACGWLKDPYGVSWQIYPSALADMISSKDTEARDRVITSFLRMKKYDIAELRRAFEGKP